MEVGPAIIITYDALKRATTMVDAVGTTAYTYSQVGQLISEDGPWTDDTVSLGYNNRLRSSLGILNPVGTSWAQTYGYDVSERLTSVTSPAGVFGYQYDTTRNTRIATLALPGGSSISNNFNSVARLTGTYLKNSSGAITNSHVYTINLGGQRTVQTRVDGSFVSYRYDNEGELISARGYEAGGITSRTNEFFGYVYDAAGNLQYRTNSGLVQTFSVNADNELTTVTRSGTLTVSGTTTTNATSVTVNGLTANRYGDATFALGGFTITNVVLSTTVRSNLTGWAGLRFAVGSSPVVVTALGRWVVSGNSGSHALKLVRSDGNDVPGATATVNLSGISTNQFSYASLSTPVVLEANTTYFLVSQEVTNGDKWYDYNSTLTPSSGFTINGTVWATNGTASYILAAGTNSGYVPVNLKFTPGGWNLAGETHYIYDGMTVVQERDQNNVPLVTYTRGQDLSGSLQGAGGIGGLLARTDQTASAPSHAYYHADGNGNITAMISYQQNLVARYLYDLFGNTLAKAGLLADANSYRFSSKEWHTGSLLYYHGFRYYSPTFQRWMNKDLIGVRGGYNLYQYAYNCPIFYVDIYGLAPEGRLIGGEIGGGIGGWIGGIIGGGFGVVGGGAGGTVIEPGGGTIVGGVEGGIIGGEIGAGIGADIGGAIGAIIGDILTDQLNSVSDDQLSDSDKYPLSNRDKNLAKRPSMKGDKEYPPPKTGDETGNRERDREQFHKNKSREGRRPKDNYGGEGRRPSGYGPTD